MIDKVDEKKVIRSKIKRFKRGSALDKQIGGEHYKNAKIDPIELIVAHNLDFIDGNIIKYAIRKKTLNLKEKSMRKLNITAR